ncbi:hypothetical protein VTK56DRAFT_7870 [Thermocarpiscus australiensis]
MFWPGPALHLAILALTVSFARAASNYSIVDVFDSNNFFDEFEFFSQPDPTHGFVKYVDAATANRDGLAGFADGGIFFGVDYTNQTTTGRPSVRLTSKKAYTKGLFIADIAHMPAGTTDSGSCGLWPAFWMFGPDWPNSGEIDILEGVNTQSSNSITLHTSAGCSVANTNSIPSTKLVSPDCQGNEGCSQATQATNNYGAGFNAAGGGVYVVEWTDTAIRVWFFPRDSSTAAQLTTTAATSSAPDPSTFGTPLAAFEGGASCPVDAHFANHNIVFNTAFCGDWAGKVWSADRTCAALAATCEDYVGANPQAFAQAFWVVNSVRVYQVREAQGRRRRVRMAGEGGRGSRSRA